jgi:hypothetical protein
VLYAPMLMKWVSMTLLMGLLNEPRERFLRNSSW